MRPRSAFAIVLTTIFFCASFSVGFRFGINLVYGQTTLADAINACALNWTTDSSTVKFAMVFNALPLSYYDTLVQQYSSIGDWLDVFRVKRFSEIDGYDSPTIEQAIQQALSNMPMLENLPLTWTYSGNPYYMVYHRFILNAYRYAALYGQTEEWNQSAAYQELSATYQAAGEPSLAYNPVNQTILQSSAPRYYDEAAETLDSFVKLGGNDSDLWDYIQNQYWTGSIYGYNGPQGQYECEVGFFAMVIANYYATSGRNLTNFDRVYLDLYNKLLAQGWSSVAWGVPGVLRHASSNPQLRLENTLGAIQALHAYSAGSTWEQDFVNLLSGSAKAWNALMASPLYSSGRFMMSSAGSFSDSATAVGMMTLFLEGITPSTGSLAMPLNDEGYEDVFGLSPASLFRFDYVNETIRIPVNPGELKFQFGTETASHAFSSAGVYEVQFDSSWNTITNVNKVGPLNSQFQYLAINTSPPTYHPLSLGVTSAIAGFNSTFYCDWSSSTPLSGFILSDNNTGTMVNETWTSFNSLGTGNSWSNYTLTLNSSAVTIQWLFYANSSADAWNDTMPPQYLTIRPGIHDIAVTAVIPAKTIIGRGFPFSVNVTVANVGDYPEQFNVTAYVDTTAVNPPSYVNLTSGDSTALMLTLNTSAFDMGNCCISAAADPVPAEINTTNNNCTDGLITITIPGDINGDFRVSLADLVILAQDFGFRPGESKWNPNADIDANGVVSLADLVTLAVYYGQHYG
jgi:hypothetical protein